MEREVFHYHITIHSVTAETLKTLAKCCKAKPTTIDLYNGKVSRDRMLTKYSNSYRAIKASLFEDCENLRFKGFVISRAKIEQVMEEFVFQETALYSEAHVKVLDSELDKIEGLHLSKNPVEGTRFYNARASTFEEFVIAKEALGKIKKPLNRQYEVCLFDSNINHDSWWVYG